MSGSVGGLTRGHESRPAPDPRGSCSSRSGRPHGSQTRTADPMHRATWTCKGRFEAWAGSNEMLARPE
jgi:hypothetical protein